MKKSKMPKFLKKLLNKIKNKFRNFLRRYDFEIVGSNYYSELNEMLLCIGEGFRSYSQYKQDIFVMTQLGFKRGGFFVEFGATNGLELSNTYILEKQLGWSGILAEPARCWHKELRINRQCYIETDCVWSKTGEILKFNQVNSANVSTIDLFSDVADGHEKARKKSTLYEVTSISLLDLLKKFNAPKIIDYLSIDTEGSEYEILSNFDFQKYQFKVITCEHNHTSAREKIFMLLTSKGYERKFSSLSMCDDWYIFKGN
jgi:FkbM family methyltransferase